MVKVRGSWFTIGGRLACGSALAIAVAGSASGCDFIGSSKIAHGQRYQSDDSRYDPYFDSVHQQQVAAASWPDEKKAARRPLVVMLGLTPAADDGTIVEAARARTKKLGTRGSLDLASAHVTPIGAGDAPLFAAVEESVRLEIERARRLKSTSDKLAEMAKRGEELKKSADRAYENGGAAKADVKESEKRSEIRRELGGAIESLRTLARSSSNGVRIAQDFVGDLGDAIEVRVGSSRGRRPRTVPPPPPAAANVELGALADEPKPPKANKPSKPARPAAEAPAERPLERPAPKPAPPPPPPSDEVFNP